MPAGRLLEQPTDELQWHLWSEREIRALRRAAEYGSAVPDLSLRTKEQTIRVK
jgi:hypothetical protein